MYSELSKIFQSHLLSNLDLHKQIHNKRRGSIRPKPKRSAIQTKTELRREVMKKIQQLTNKHSKKKRVSVKQEKEKVGQLEQYMQERHTELVNKQSIKGIKKPRMGDTSLVDLKSKVVSDPKKPKKKKFKVMNYDVFSSTSESDNMDEPPKYMSLTCKRPSKSKLFAKNMFITPVKSPSITPNKSKLHPSPSLRSNKSHNRDNNEFFGNIFLNQSYPLKLEAPQKSSRVRTPNKSHENENVMVSINQVDDSGSKNLLYEPKLWRDKSETTYK